MAGVHAGAGQAKPWQGSRPEHGRGSFRRVMAGARPAKPWQGSESEHARLGHGRGPGRIPTDEAMEGVQAGARPAKPWKGSRPEPSGRGLDRTLATESSQEDRSDPGREEPWQGHSVQFPAVISKLRIRLRIVASAFFGTGRNSTKATLTRALRADLRRITLTVQQT
jgi:hypothetical protein